MEKPHPATPKPTQHGPPGTHDAPGTLLSLVEACLTLLGSRGIERSPAAEMGYDPTEPPAIIFQEPAPFKAASKKRLPTPHPGPPPQLPAKQRTCSNTSAAGGAHDTCLQEAFVYADRCTENGSGARPSRRRKCTCRWGEHQQGMAMYLPTGSAQGGQVAASRGGRRAFGPLVYADLAWNPDWAPTSCVTGVELPASPDAGSALTQTLPLSPLGNENSFFFK